jgi:hypothetical protein
VTSAAIDFATTGPRDCAAFFVTHRRNENIVEDVKHGRIVTID